MEQIMIDIMNSFGYFGIFFLIMIENVFPPIPSELILTFGGFMTVSSNMTVVGVIIAATLGSLLGAFILYGIGKLLNKERLIKIVTSKYGKLLRVKPKDIEAADHWFDTKGSITVLICRCVPIVRSLISVPAGMSDMPIPKFFFFFFIGSVVWNTFLVCVGAFAGDQKDAILAFIDQVSHIILIVLVIAFVGFVIWFYKRKTNKKEKVKHE